jgi:hypothetical protein
MISILQVASANAAGNQNPQEVSVKESHFSQRKREVGHPGAQSQSGNINSQFSSTFHKEDSSSTVSSQRNRLFVLRGATIRVRVDSAKRESS